MTNEEILESWGVETRESMLACDTDLTLQNTLEMMDEVRKDERAKWKGHLLNSVLTDAEFEEYTGSKREKMQGVDVWVSVDEDGTAKLSESELEFFEREKWGMFKYPERGFCVALPHQFGEFLKVEEGECVKFRIVRQP